MQLRVAGLSVAVESAHPTMGRALLAAWEPAVVADDGPVDRHYRIATDGQVFLDGIAQFGDEPLSHRVAHIELNLLNWVVARHRGWALLHAGAVLFEGDLWIFVGDSGAGKSSFTRAALKRGGQYISDDAVFVRGAEVHGVARSVQFDPRPNGDRDVPDYLRDCDLDSYEVPSESGVTCAVPLWRAGYSTLGTLRAPSGRVVVAEIRQAESLRIDRQDALGRLCALRAAALASGAEYDGSLGHGAAFSVAWAQPEEAFAGLVAELARLREA